MRGAAAERLHRIDLPAEGSFLAREDVSAEILLAALRAHRDNRPPSVRLKANLGRVVSRVQIEPARDAAGARAPSQLVVKEVPLPWRRRLLYSLGATCRFRGDFERARRLAEIGFPTPSVLACSLRPAGPREFEITEFISGALSLRELLWLGENALADASERAELLHDLGRWLRRLHERRVWERDLKPNNVLVRRRRPGPLEFFLVDITETRFLGRPLDAERRARNLGQLLDLPARLDASAPPALVKGYLDLSEHAGIDRWLERVGARIESRRAHRLRSTGYRYVDEEYRYYGERP
jgi:tRNA A-37 threonylcarbamoyl transferase component Bud32